MIIKTLKGRTGLYRNSLAYLLKGAPSNPKFYLEGIYHDSFDVKRLNHAFLEHERQFRVTRKRKPVRYRHHILSFSPKDSLILKEQPEILIDLMREYIDLRTQGKTISAGIIHEEKDHIHAHILTSNFLITGRLEDIKNKQYHSIRRSLENIQKERYPQLNESLVHIQDYSKTQREKKRRESLKTLHSKKLQTKTKVLSPKKIDGAVQNSTQDKKEQLKQARLKSQQQSQEQDRGGNYG